LANLSRRIACFARRGVAQGGMHGDDEEEDEAWENAEERGKNRTEKV
jgi:hypothetical protein